MKRHYFSPLELPVKATSDSHSSRRRNQKLGKHCKNLKYSYRKAGGPSLHFNLRFCIHFSFFYCGQCVLQRPHVGNIMIVYCLPRSLATLTKTAYVDCSNTYHFVSHPFSFLLQRLCISKMNNFLSFMRSRRRELKFRWLLDLFQRIEFLTVHRVSHTHTMDHVNGMGCTPLTSLHTLFVYYEAIKQELKRRPIYEYRCDERLKRKLRFPDTAKKKQIDWSQR